MGVKSAPIRNIQFQKYSHGVAIIVYSRVARLERYLCPQAIFRRFPALAADRRRNLTLQQQVGRSKHHSAGSIGLGSSDTNSRIHNFYIQ